MEENDRYSGFMQWTCIYAVRVLDRYIAGTKTIIRRKTLGLLAMSAPQNMDFLGGASMGSAPSPAEQNSCINTILLWVCVYRSPRDT